MEGNHVTTATPPEAATAAREILHTLELQIQRTAWVMEQVGAILKQATAGDEFNEMAFWADSLDAESSALLDILNSEAVETDWWHLAYWGCTWDETRAARRANGSRVED